jgi:hypothetical protein
MRTIQGYDRYGHRFGRPKQSFACFEILFGVSGLYDGMVKYGLCDSLSDASHFQYIADGIETADKIGIAISRYVDQLPISFSFVV